MGFLSRESLPLVTRASEGTDFRAPRPRVRPVVREEEARLLGRVVRGLLTPPCVSLAGTGAGRPLCQGALPPGLRRQPLGEKEGLLQCQPVPRSDSGRMPGVLGHTDPD